MIEKPNIGTNTPSQDLAQGKELNWAAPTSPKPLGKAGILSVTMYLYWVTHTILTNFSEEFTGIKYYSYNSV